jgi:hypothetical protein
MNPPRPRWYDHPQVILFLPTYPYPASTEEE